MVRTILGLLFGIALAAGIVYGAQYGYAQLHPPPGTSGPAATPEALFAFVRGAHPEDLSKFAFTAPTDALACVLGGWALAGLFGGWIAAAIAKPNRGPAATVVGALLTVAVIVYAVAIPNVAWLTVVGLLLPMPFAVLAGRMAMPRREF